MVWFQCEDCGDNLKKPKLPTHFRVCSAFKLSCIDCGQVFGQHDVETHTQCITEAEKYGPKGQGKVSNGTNTTPKSNTKQKPEVDINVGLSERPPWFCSLCKTSATSKQTLLSHADGKKHRGKARAFHAANQQPNDTKETKDLAESNATNEAPDSKVLGNGKDQNTAEVAPLPTVENDASKSNKKRKLTSDKDGVRTGGDVSADLSNGAVVQINGAETEATKGLKKAKHSGAKEDARSDSTLTKDSQKKEIKWKNLIISALKSKDGVMKFKKLQKFVANSLEESGFKEEKKQVAEILEQKINSSSRFIMDGKSVRLAANRNS